MEHGDGAVHPRPRAFMQCFNGRLIYAVTLIALSQLNFGMDQGAFSGTQAMTSFEQKFGVWDEGKGKFVIEPYYLSLLNSLNYIGFAFGLVSGNLISRWWGRRRCMLVMCCWALVAAIILVTAQHRAQMLVGRIIAYVYIGMELALVPVLQSELVPARVRGFVVGTYQSGLLFGQLTMALICQRTAKIEGEASWRIPLGLFFIVPSILICGVWFLPESPRWLLLQDQPDAAMASLRLLREGKFTDEEIEAEFQEIKGTINLTVDRGRFKEQFRGTNLKRTLIVVGVNVFLQLTGQNFSSIYGTIFIKSLNTINPFAMNSINSGVNIVMVFITQALTDMTGRVPLMVAGAAVQCTALFTMGALGTISSPSPEVKKAITAMVTVFGVGFQLGWAPLSHVVAAEIPTTRLRDLTYAVGSVFNITIQFAVSFSIPYLLNAPYANLGSKVGFIFGTTAFGAVIFSWFCIPECSGKTLEEIDRLFLEGMAIKDFKKMGRVGDNGGLEAGGKVAEVDYEERAP
ncbi:related to RGT2 - Sensor of high external glucose concentrations [Cephalotrichum gorgonifer]|uniref:Related to RGT2 - Sensor of high external glucose concentrations n=1 Tax=Cephalotrichum gorgonifer TaxID=2041049 RepID=A0AAE8MY37_9PEZI|nr:related to RGT2 - Sensor of high external glucose concentrations [Cephalotrichum gorgonifer]